MKHNAIVVGSHTSALYAVRSFGRCKVKVAVIDSRSIGEARFSKYCYIYKKVKIINSENILEKIYELEKELGSCVIIPATDETAAILSQNYRALSNNHIPMIPPWNVTSKAHNKKLTYQIAAKQGIPIPKTCFPSNIDELHQQAKDFKFPAILKPAVMHSFNKITGKKVIIVNNYNELSHYYNQVLAVITAPEIMFQEIIPGGAENLYSYCSIFHNHSPFNDFVARRARQIPMDFGKASTFVEMSDIPELKTYGSKLLDAIGFSGLSEVEFKFDIEDKQYKLLEINPRLWKWCAIADLLGANLPLNAYRLKIGQRIDSIDYPIEQRLIWTDILSDVYIAVNEIIKGNLSVSGWLKSYDGKHIDSTFSSQDMMPGIVLLITAPFVFFNIFLHKHITKRWRR